MNFSLTMLRAEALIPMRKAVLLSCEGCNSV